MGDIADMMIEGVLCESCGSYMGKETGYPDEEGFPRSCCDKDHYNYIGKTKKSFLNQRRGKK